MSLDERLVADCTGTGMTIGKHPMAYRQTEMDELCVTPAAALHSIANGRTFRVAGERDRASTPRLTFVSLEDETGISNVVIMPDLFEEQQREILTHAWVMVEGRMQNVDSVIHILTQRIFPLANLFGLETSAQKRRC